MAKTPHKNIADQTTIKISKTTRAKAKSLADDYGMKMYDFCERIMLSSLEDAAALRDRGRIHKSIRQGER